MKSKYKVIQNGERVPSGEPVFQVAETIDGEDVVVVTELMTKKEAEAALQALSPQKKEAPKKEPVKKKAPVKKAAKKSSKK
jgi:acyl-CoA reductase-like NAD-dependent aldehyde dehydrogenase